MRYPAFHKSRTRSALVRSAARQVRAKGTESLRLADATKAAGMTNGGFYKHFKDKEELVREAIGFALAENAEKFSNLTINLPRQTALRKLIETYLSEEHARHPERGCPVAALGSEIARLPPSSKKRVGEALGSYTNRLLHLMPGDSESSRRSAFAVLFSSMAGCIISARAHADGEQRKSILNDARCFFIRVYCEAPSGLVREGA